MKVVVTGTKGQLGHDLVQQLEEQGVECYGVNREKFDLADTDYTDSYINKILPDVIIHCAAYTNVEMAEVEQKKCWIQNVEITSNLASISEKIGAKFVYLSTDYVFSGEQHQPYETDAETNPLSVYGRTKLYGEQEVLKRVKKHFIIRTSWAFGVNGRNFVKTMLSLGKDSAMVNVVSDQYGSPTYTEDLAVLISEMINTEKYGIFHITNEGYCNWAEFAAEIFRLAGYTTKVNSIESEHYNGKVKRPKNSRLSKLSLDFADFNRLPSWENALERYLMKLGVIK
ncbi:dTDP-4-dehydrorhamnose reductase [Cytobacillus eiseniae]|uniref:dTDP-4-dehydrorhamnose reductase n=1 Tax=Cytobacillus eiseniae TaxID=762947 RepID=A0ABS4RHG4_9BACI|nr:dTDP-4-dehydrorhamnose reductase [Cytobacillus eiseniae]MBP2242352.1 dTDP-4-dehydrorhamnose reductase [Cytobacillus eiseniae]